MLLYYHNNHAFSPSYCNISELKEDHRFDLESCRSMLVMMDENKSGLLELPEVLK